MIRIFLGAYANLQMFNLKGLNLIQEPIKFSFLESNKA